MIRQATSAEVAAIAATYEDLLTYEQEHGGDPHWELGVYPTIAVPKRAVPAGEMIVLEEDGEIRASMILKCPARGIRRRGMAVSRRRRGCACRAYAVRAAAVRGPQVWKPDGAIREGICGRARLRGRPPRHLCA